MIVRRLTAALLAALAVAGCSRVASTADGRRPWTRPGELRIAMSAAPNTLNPLLSTQQVEVYAEGFIFDPLVATDPNGNDVPVLAAAVPTLENGGIGRDGRTITYHLRHGVKWHDGAPFSSRDVAFTVRAILNPKTAVATRHGYDEIARVDTPDADTVVFHLKRPFAPAVHTFFAHSDSPYFILPEHRLGKLPSLDRIPYNSAPVGTGPFKLARWSRGDRIEYVPNDDYFLGKPKLHAITLRTVPDENTIVNELRAHEIDYFFQATPRTYPALHEVKDMDVRLVPFNGNDAIQINTTRAPFDDVRVRQAVGFALDKKKLTHDVTFDTALPATEDLPSFLWAFEPKAGSITRDLPHAAALLDAAGWKLRSDGVRARAGAPLEVGLAYRSDSITDRERAVIIASMLKDAGFDVQPRGYTTALLYGQVAEGGILSGGKYQLGLQTWYAGVDPDDSSQLLCAERAPAGFNWSRYCNPAMDVAQQTALSHYDRPTRKSAYATIERLLAQDAPFVYLWWQRQISAVNPDFKDFKPNGIIDSWNAYQWSI